MQPTWRQLLEPGAKLLTKITKLFSSKRYTTDISNSYSVPVSFQYCGPWYTYRNSVWALESSVDPLWGSSVDPPCTCKTKLRSSTQSTCTDDISVEDNKEWYCDKDSMKHKGNTFSTLHVQQTKQQNKPDNTLVVKQDKATSSSSCEVNVPTKHLKPTTPSFFLSKSVHRHTTLKTIAEDDVADFSDEFSKPLPSLHPFSLIPRRQNGQEYNGDRSIEWTKVVSPHSFKVSDISTTVENPLGNLNGGEMVFGEDKNDTEKGHPDTHSSSEPDEMENAAQLTNTYTMLSIDQNSNHEQLEVSTSAVELITPMDAPTSSTFPVISEGNSEIPLGFDSEEKSKMIIVVTDVDELGCTTSEDKISEDLEAQGDDFDKEEDSQTLFYFS